MSKDIINLLDSIPVSSQKEIFETLIKNDTIKIERIVSYGQITPQNYWYNQTQNEFVLIVSGAAKIKYDNGTIYHLKENDLLNIPAFQKHQVIYTNNPTVWLAIFY